MAGISSSKMSRMHWNIRKKGRTYNEALKIVGKAKALSKIIRNGKMKWLKRKHPYLDFDGDGKVNKYDCHPLNKNKQDIIKIEEFYEPISKEGKYRGGSIIHEKEDLIEYNNLNKRIIENEGKLRKEGRIREADELKREIKKREANIEWMVNKGRFKPRTEKIEMNTFEIDENKKLLNNWKGLKERAEKAGYIEDAKNAEKEEREAKKIVNEIRKDRKNTIRHELMHRELLEKELSNEGFNILRRQKTDEGFRKHRDLNKMMIRDKDMQKDFDISNDERDYDERERGQELLVRAVSKYANKELMRELPKIRGYKIIKEGDNYKAAISRDDPIYLERNKADYSGMEAINGEKKEKTIREKQEEILERRKKQRDEAFEKGRI